MFPKKSLGQYFLRCPWVIEELLRAAEINQNDTVLEIGPGTGTLTRPLAHAAKKVIAVEKDERLAAALANTLKKEEVSNVEIIPADILDLLNFDITYKLSAKSYKLVANIPYYLTSRLLRLVLEQETLPQTIILTVQKEVAERICAVVPNMSLLALSIQLYAKPLIKKFVPRECFSPKPSVDSAVISISPRKINFFSEHGLDPNIFFTITKKAFGQKRKTIGHSLALKNILLPPSLKRKRPQDLTPEEWTAIIRALVL